MEGRIGEKMWIEITTKETKRKKTKLNSSGCSQLGRPKSNAHTFSANAANPISAIASIN